MNFFQEKAGNPLEKQTAAPLQNPVVTLPVSTILQAQCLTFKKLYFFDSKTAQFQPFCIAVIIEIPKVFQFQVLPEVLTKKKNNKLDPSHAEFGFLQFQQNLGLWMFYLLNHTKHPKTGIVLCGIPL